LPYFCSVLKRARLQAEARKVLKAVGSWMRVKSEKASMDELKATFLPSAKLNVGCV
jgi:hypothetical protein